MIRINLVTGALKECLRRRRYRELHPYQCKVYPRICRECGGNFEGKTKRSVFCSIRCKDKHRGRIRRNNDSYKEYFREYSKEYYAQHPEECRKKTAKCRYRKFGMTPEEIAARLVEQNNLCAVCKRPFENGIFVADHCHKNNKFRGLLHKKCNSLLGFADDSPTILKRAAEYLECQGGISG